MYIDLSSPAFLKLLLWNTFCNVCSYHEKDLLATLDTLLLTVPSVKGVMHDNNSQDIWWCNSSMEVIQRCISEFDFYKIVSDQGLLTC